MHKWFWQRLVCLFDFQAFEAMVYKIKMYSRNGGFIIGMKEFDSKMFGIVEGEARAMDPHQRILLELVYESFFGILVCQKIN